MLGPLILPLLEASLLCVSRSMVAVRRHRTNVLFCEYEQFLVEQLKMNFGEVFKSLREMATPCCNGQHDVIIQDYNVLVLNQNDTEIGNQMRFRFTHVEDESILCCLT